MWFTRRHIHVNRTATAWLLRRFLVDELLPQDAALRRLARIVHGADFPEEPSAAPESAGLWAISRGFTVVGRDAEDIVARASFLDDSPHAHPQAILGDETA